MLYSAIMDSISSISDLHEFIILPQEQLTSINSQKNEYKYWTIDHTKMLIELYGNNRKKLGSFEVRSLKKLWELIAQKLNEQFHINVTASNVENRWRVLDRNYKNYIDNNKQTGRGRKVFPFAEQMDEIFGKKKNIRPEILLSAATVDEVPSEFERIVDTENSSTDIDKNKENSLEITCGQPKRKRNRVLENRNSILEAIRRDKKEYHEARLKIESEKLEILKEKVKEMRRKNDLLSQRNKTV